jgi:hypothetical protein
MGHSFCIVPNLELAGHERSLLTIVGLERAGQGAGLNPLCHDPKLYPLRKTARDEG